MAVAYISRPTKISIAVTTQPTNTEYIQGDTLDLTGIVVTATKKDGTTENVTSSCSFSPANGSTLSSVGTITITAFYHGASTTTSITSYEIDRITVTTPPTKTSYNVGETISYSGIVVKAYANSDNIVRTVTSQCTFSPASGTTLSSTGSFSSTITWRTKSTTQAYTVSAKIYGAEWAGGSSSAWTRTDDASGFSNPVPAVNNGNGSSPFDNIMPWSGIERVEESSIYAGKNVLVKIPKFYYKWTRTGSTMKLQISMYKGTGFLTSPAHADRGDGKGERDVVYVGAYHSCVVGSRAYSYSGETPSGNDTKTHYRTYCHNVGSSYWQYDFAMYWTIMMLYLVEYADWNSQTKIGYGVGSSVRYKTGSTDAMIYHTGTSASSRGSRGSTRYRYIEGLWDSAYDVIDGFYIYNRKYYIINNPSEFSDNSNGTQLGTYSIATGVIKQWSNPTASGYEWALVPSNYSESASLSSYVTDAKWDYTFSEYGMVGIGGMYTTSVSNDYFGAFCFMAAASSYSTSAQTCRLMKLP